MAVSDEHLAVLAQHGDKRAFNALAGRHYHRWVAVAHAVTRDTHDAQDAVQNAMLRMWRHLPRYDPTRAWWGWSSTIVHHTAIDLAKARAARWAHTTEAAPLERRHAPWGTETEVLARARLREVMAGVRGLRGNRRVALVMSACGFADVEISERLGCSRVAARVAAFQARQRLRK